MSSQHDLRYAVMYKQSNFVRYLSANAQSSSGSSSSVSSGNSDEEKPTGDKSASMAPSRRNLLDQRKEFRRAKFGQEGIGLTETNRALAEYK